LYQAHGDEDDLVDIDWGSQTNKELKELGVATEFHVYPGMGHEMIKKELLQLKNWIGSVCPEKESTS